MKLVRVLSLAVAAIGLWHLLPAPAFAATCWVSDTPWINNHEIARNQLKQQVDASGRNVTQQYTINNEAYLSAIKVIARQFEVDGQRQVAMSRDAQQGEASVYIEQNKNEAILAATERFSKRGLSVDPCGSADALALAFQKIENDSVQSVVSMSDHNPGSAAPIEEVLKRRMAETKPKHLNVATFLTGTDDEARIWLNNAAGFPLHTSISGADEVSNDITFIRARRAQALRSAAIVSLEKMRNAYKKGGAVEGLDQLVDLYGGGTGYDAWQRELATKNERGLMQEFAKLRAVNMRLEQYASQSASRIATVNGVLLAGEVGNTPR